MNIHLCSTWKKNFIENFEKILKYDKLRPTQKMTYFKRRLSSVIKCVFGVRHLIRLNLEAKS